MLLPVVILLFGGASVAEGFQATPAVTARTSLYLRPRQSSCLFVSSEEDEATSALTQQQPTENTSTEPVQRPRIESQRRSVRSFRLNESNGNIPS